MACSNAGATPYPYGSSYAEGACNGEDYDQPDRSVAAGSAAACHGQNDPYAAVFDMSGNAAEWEDACVGASGASDSCRPRGGSYNDSASALGCYADADQVRTRSSTSAEIGFRCCAF